MLKNSIALILLLTIAVIAGLEASHAQGNFRDRIKQRIQSRISARKTQSANNTQASSSKQVKKIQIAGLQVAVWEPEKIPEAGAPIVIFSHGFHGAGTQSKFLMEALAKAGYLVFAPDHKDAMGSGSGGGFSKPEEKLGDVAAWSDKTHKDRADDIVNMISALHKDPNWNSKIDWAKLALAGHSLGGYTALGLAGAWPSWKISEVKAVLALSPYCQPFAKHETLHNLNVPVMYQSGTIDFGIAPFIQRPGGAFDQTPAPEIYVVFDKVHHFSFSDLNKKPEQMDLIAHYSVAFLNKYVLGESGANPEKKVPGVFELRTK